jgi:hypothetical protein
MPGIEFTSRPGKTFIAAIKDPNDDYAVLATGIAMTEISPSRYRGAYNGSGVVWVQAVAEATTAVGFADFDSLQENGYAEVSDSVSKTSVTVLPLVAVERERQKANVIPLFVGEQATTSVTVKSTNGSTVDITGKTLSLKIETQQKSPVASLAVTVTTPRSFTFIPTSSVTSSPRTLEWALWDTVAKAVIAHGTLQIAYVPVM